MNPSSSNAFNKDIISNGKVDDSINLDAHVTEHAIQLDNRITENGASKEAVAAKASLWSKPE
jgi:hypothetical protein